LSMGTRRTRTPPITHIATIAMATPAPPRTEPPVKAPLTEQKHHTPLGFDADSMMCVPLHCAVHQVKKFNIVLLEMAMQGYAVTHAVLRSGRAVGRAAARRPLLAVGAAAATSLGGATVYAYACTRSSTPHPFPQPEFRARALWAQNVVGDGAAAAAQLFPSPIRTAQCEDGGAYFQGDADDDDEYDDDDGDSGFFARNYTVLLTSGGVIVA
jgi:hypothetical protein